LCFDQPGLTPETGLEIDASKTSGIASHRARIKRIIIIGAATVCPARQTSGNEERIRLLAVFLRHFSIFIKNLPKLILPLVLLLPMQN
jgi:hypothetical protein